MVKIVATADLHGHLPKIESCEILLIAGDLCPEKTQSEQVAWLDGPFRNWLESVDTRHIVCTAGNHDYFFEKSPELIPKGLRWHYLLDSGFRCEGLSIYGTPWQTPFCGAFNLPEEKLASIYAKIPLDTDIILSHGAPFEIGDELFNAESNRYTLTGSPSLRKRALAIKPKLCIFGHIHSQYGLYEVEGITFANVSLVNDDREPVNPPMVFEL